MLYVCYHPIALPMIRSQTDQSTSGNCWVKNPIKLAGKTWIFGGNSLYSLECLGARGNAGKSDFRAQQKSMTTQSICQVLPKA
ncbi:unnamed protein product [Linum tenue]|uniref:Uncharacterized protein n=1 Tax=Linum tenue TaxID=586396 RepID=A0AAV0PE38_9ROSI|nr:unnamed protein product [Linum tenue]